MLIHRDEAMVECLAAKQPVGEYRSDALAAEEILTLANWCLLNYSAENASRECIMSILTRGCLSCRSPRLVGVIAIIVVTARRLSARRSAVSG